MQQFIDKEGSHRGLVHPTGFRAGISHREIVRSNRTPSAHKHQDTVLVFFCNTCTITVPMRIAVAASLLKAISPESTGGTEAFAHILSDSLASAGINTTLFATSDSQTRAKLVSVCHSSQTTGVYEGNVEIRMPYQLLQSAEILKRSQEFDLIHNNYFGFFALTAFSHFSPLPIVTTMHNHFWHYPNLKKILTDTVRKNKDIVVFPSHASAKYNTGLFDSQVIYHGIDITPFQFSREPEDYVLFFSRLVPGKGIKDAIDAATQGNFRLIAAGGKAILPDDKEFIEKNVTPYFSNSITYAGVPDKNERLKLYQKAKALLFPTHLEEQFGLVSVESMACGTPVIAYNHGANAEVIEDGVTGFIIDPNNEDRPKKGAWIIKKQGVEGLIEAVGRIGEIDRAACRKRVEEKFTRERMIKEYLELYKRLTS